MKLLKHIALTAVSFGMTFALWGVPPSTVMAKTLPTSNLEQHVNNEHTISTSMQNMTASMQNTSQPSSSASIIANAVSSGTADGFSQNDINLMAHVVYGEARNQPFTGQVAVAAVILNRFHSNVFPHSIPGVIYQPGAFTSMSNGQAWLGLHRVNVQAVLDAIHGWDPTHGALYYWNPATATSQWIWSQPIMLQIGNHVFAK